MGRYEKTALLEEIQKVLREQDMAQIAFPFQQEQKGVFQFGLFVKSDGKDIWLEQNGRYLEPTKFPKLYKHIAIPAMWNQLARWKQYGKTTKYKGKEK